MQVNNNNNSNSHAHAHTHTYIIIHFSSLTFIKYIITMYTYAQLGKYYNIYNNIKQ